MSYVDTPLARFSTILLEIYRLAREETIERFHETVLECIKGALPFEKAWWGRAAQSEDGQVEQSSYLYRLPAKYLEDWQAIRHQDITVQRVYAEPGRAAVVDMQAAASPEGLRWLAKRHGIHELLCVIHTDPSTQLSDHLSLYRPSGAAPFEPEECQLLECLMPHLAAAVAVNQIRTLVALRESLSEQRLALAVCNREGMLYSAEPGFVEILLIEWPKWVGPQLPVGLKLEGYEGKHLHIEARQITDLYLLNARSRCAIEQLSAREIEVAKLFGDGKTYKEIARLLAVSPHTVRHHLRTIYSKLGVHGKVGVAHLLHQLPPPYT